MLKRLLPLLAFLLLAGLLFAGIRMNERREAQGVDPNALPSPLIGRSAPSFALPELRDPAAIVSTDSLRGAPYLLNVWGSWCPACRIEHPLVAQLADSGRVRVVGLNYKDERDDALPWLARNGDPFKVSVYDRAGRIAIDYGVYGVPETYVIDRKGIIRYKHIGPLTPEVAQQKLRPLIEGLAKRG